MKCHIFLATLAILLVGCAQQPAATNPSTPTPTPAVSPQEQQQAEQFKSTPCFNTNIALDDYHIDTLALKLRENIETLSYISPDSVPDYSARVFTRFLDDLDRQHHYFLSSDLESLRVYEQLLWATFKQGNVKPGFCIYALYDQRATANFQHVLDYLNNRITEQDINGNDILTLRDDKSPFFTNEIEQKDYWRKKALHELLLKMANGANFPDAKRSLIKRYQGYLARFTEATSQDTFTIYANAFLTVLDPHSQYFPPKVSKDFDINHALQLEGIGVVLQQNDEGATVVSTVPGGPSSGKLHPGDLILAVAKNGVDFEPVGGWRLDNITELMRGPKESWVGLEVKPAQSNASVIRLTIQRNTVKLQDRVVQSDILSIHRAGQTYRLGVLHVPSFYADLRAMKAGDPDAHSTSRDLAKHIATLQANHVQGLVLDLVDNGGGSLQEANDVAALFIAQRPIFQVASKNAREVLGSPNRESKFSGPLLVLVNDRSAGSSEIVAGALQDYGIGIVVGRRTFGMGSVASLRELTSDSQAMVKISMAQFYRTTGAPFLEIGVTPDVELPSRSMPVREPKSIRSPSSISAVKNFSTLGDLSSLRPKLQQRSAARQQKSSGFAYIRATHQDFEERIQQKTIILNLKNISATQEVDKQASQARFAAYAKSAGEDSPPSSADDENTEKRIWLQEAGELIVDWLEVKQ